MKTILVCAIVAAAAFPLVVEPAFGQTTSGQISGQVVDPGNQPIPHATVTLTNQLTTAQRVVTTDDSGAFVFVSVQPGTFSISIAAEAFKTFTKRDLMLTASERLSAGTVHMEIGGISEQVSVVAEVTPVQTVSGER